MTNKVGKSWTGGVVALLVVGAAVLVVWKFGAVRETFYRSLSSAAIVPLPEYHIADIPQIVATAAANTERFNQLYRRNVLSGEVAFDGVEVGGGSAYLVKTRVTGEAGGAVICAMNKFKFEAARDTVSGFKSGDAVRISGPIGSAAGTGTVLLTDGCMVERSYAPVPAK